MARPPSKPPTVIGPGPGAVPVTGLLILAAILVAVIALGLLRERNRGCLAWTEYVPAAQRGHAPSLTTEVRR